MTWKSLLIPGGWRGMLCVTVVVALAIVALYVPAALAFPYRAQIGATAIYADRPIDAAIGARLARADRLLAASPIDVAGLPRTIVLTDGGWRWRVMAAGYGEVIALRRPFAAVLVFNRSDVAADRVSNGARIGGVRTLSGTIAHEMTHVLVARRYGELAMARMPTWLREGYADHVAGETSIGRDDEARIRAANPNARVLVYYDGRRRVAALLAANGGSVDALLAPR